MGKTWALGRTALDLLWLVLLSLPSQIGECGGGQGYFCRPGRGHGQEGGLRGGALASRASVEIIMLMEKELEHFLNQGSRGMR